MERQAGELADEGIEANERLKATINADIIALALFMNPRISRYSRSGCSALRAKHTTRLVRTG